MKTRLPRRVRRAVAELCRLASILTDTLPTREWTPELGRAGTEAVRTVGRYLDKLERVLGGGHPVGDARQVLHTLVQAMRAREEERGDDATVLRAAVELVWSMDDVESELPRPIAHTESVRDERAILPRRATA